MNYEAFALDFLTETTEKIKELEKKDFGRNVVGGVKGKPDDEEIGIDIIGEKILKKKLAEYNISAQVFSEHYNIDSTNPDVFIVIDPFDGSSIYKHGLPHMWYVALGIFDKNHNPVFAGVSEIMANRIYFTRPDGSYVKFLYNDDEKKLVPNFNKTKIDSISAYIMKQRRLLGFHAKFKEFLSSLGPKALIYPNGGPGIFPYVAGGNIDAYIVDDETRLEIDSGFFIAQNAGCLINEITKDGLVPYKFIPGKQQQRVNLLITPNKEIQDQIVKYLKIGRR